MYFYGDKEYSLNEEKIAMFGKEPNKEKSAVKEETEIKKNVPEWIAIIAKHLMLQFSAAMWI